jgi:hypothetical protein
VRHSSGCSSSWQNRTDLLTFGPTPNGNRARIDFAIAA